MRLFQLGEMRRGSRALDWWGEVDGVDGRMREVLIGQAVYPLEGPEPEIALAYALGAAFIELQQLEYSIVSYLCLITDGKIGPDSSFELFASKTFGNLIREMRNHELLIELAADMQAAKARRDFFIHKFLFNRYGGPAFTTDIDYDLLVRDAIDHGDQFAASRKRFDDHMLQRAPVTMFAGKLDPDTGEIVITASEHAKNAKVG